MNLYLISQTINENWGTYDSAVVVAPSMEEARKMHPSSGKDITKPQEYLCPQTNWVTDPIDVRIIYLGLSFHDYKSGTIICSSFNAG